MTFCILFADYCLPENRARLTPTKPTCDAKLRDTSKRSSRDARQNAASMARSNSRNRGSVMTLTMVKASISFKASHMS